MSNGNSINLSLSTFLALYRMRLPALESDHSSSRGIAAFSTFSHGASYNVVTIDACDGKKPVTEHGGSTPIGAEAIQARHSQVALRKRHWSCNHYIRLPEELPYPKPCVRWCGRLGRERFATFLPDFTEQKPAPLVKVLCQNGRTLQYISSTVYK